MERLRLANGFDDNLATITGMVDPQNVRNKDLLSTHSEWEPADICTEALDLSCPRLKEDSGDDDCRDSSKAFKKRLLQRYESTTTAVPVEPEMTSGQLTYGDDVNSALTADHWLRASYVLPGLRENLLRYRLYCQPMHFITPHQLLRPFFNAEATAYRRSDDDDEQSLNDEFVRYSPGGQTPARPRSTDSCSHFSSDADTADSTSDEYGVRWSSAQHIDQRAPPVPVLRRRGGGGGRATSRPGRTRKTGKLQVANNNNNRSLLWQFLLDLLHNSAYNPHYISWLDESRGVFRLNNTRAVSQLWGASKNKPQMNYDTMGRALRYYYTSGVLNRVKGQRLVYQFASQPK